MSQQTPDAATSSSATGARSSGSRSVTNRAMRGNRAGRTRNGGTTPSRPTFKGDTEDMNGNVFQCYEEQADRRQYAKTLEALDAYVKKKLIYSADLASLFATTMRTPTIDLPSDLAPGAGETMKMIFAEEVKEYVKRTRALASNIATVFAVIWGQCSENMKARVKTSEHYADKAIKNDCFWLLRQIKSITLQFDESKNAILSLLDAQQSFLSCKQSPGQSADDYADSLIGWAETIETHGGTVAADYTLIPETGDDGLPRDVQRRKALARERTLAMALIRSADRSRYGTLITDLRNQYASGRDEYPTDVVTAKSLLVTYKTPVNASTSRNANTRVQQAASPEASAMTFAQRTSSSVVVPGTNGLTHDDIQCWTCQQHGHYAGNCPTGETTSGTTLTQYAFMLAQSAAPASEHEHVIDPDWILLDSQSTMSVFRNAGMLRNIRHSGRVLRALTNGGYQDSTMVGDFPNLGEVWFNKHSIANILSLAEVRKVCRVTMDTSNEPALHVHRLDGSVMKFIEHPSGLYVYNSNDTSARVTGYTMVNTVAKQKKLFSRREVRAADQARELYRKIGRPAETEFVELLKCNAIRNCPVTPSDAQRALIIYGPDIAALKGKTTHSHAAPRAPTFIAETIPASVLEHHRNVTLCVDFFFVQGLPFFHTISRGIGYRTAHPVPDRSKQTIMRRLRAVIKMYQARGLTVCDIHGDHEFGCIRESLRPIGLNVVPADSHVGEVERSIRTVKERLRSCAHGLPFKRLPRLLVQYMVADTIRCLNQFPWPNGISATMSPASIVTGVGTPDYNCMRIEFGAYAQVFEDNSPSNTLRARSLGAIALTPTGNAQGDYFFLSLATGSRLSRHQWTELPITDTAIARTEALALHDKQPLLQNSGLVVEWRPDQPIDDSEYDLDYVPPANADAPHVFDADDYDAIDNEELRDLLADNPYAPLADAADQGAEDDDDDSDDGYSHDPNDGGAGHDYYESDDEDDDNAPNDAVDHHAAGRANDEGEQPVEDGEEEQPAEDAAEEGAQHIDDEGAQHDIEGERRVEDEGAEAAFLDEGERPVEDEGAEAAVLNDATERPYNLRQRLPATSNTFKQAMDTPHDGKSYFPPTQLLQQEHHSFAQLMNQLAGSANIREQVKRHGKTAETTLMKHVFGFIMNQMSAKAGIRKHGKAAETALMKEFAQLEDLSAYESIDPATLTKKQRREALRAINLLKEKRDGSLRARTVADGRPQRSMYDKSQTASPTVSTDALMLSIMIDAKEARDVATADVVAAYLKAFMDDFVIMKFTGESVDILCKMNPDHTKHVAIEGGTKVLYVRLVKALYGCVKSALLWYELFSGTLKKMGFELNPYDSCIANSTINGKQCTIAWYVDDTKISHADPNVVTSIIEEIEASFGKMTVKRGTEHVFLGMLIKYTGKGTAVITMKEYLEEALVESGMNITRSVATPALRDLFDVDENSPPLERGEAESFHSVTAKLLYVSTRARVDLLLAIAFLCTRVSKSTKQDREKLKRVLEYIHGSMDREYTIGADDMGRMMTWVDAAFAVHPDMKSHTGGVISFGRGGIVCKSTKQKLNTKSSTEAEFVGASDYLPNAVWVKFFLEAQGYTMESNVLAQDNESAIKLEKNGRMSAGPKSRHIDIRYFWIKDRLKTGAITVEHCPTLEMLADFFTKPLQGRLFKRFRDVLLGNLHVNALAAPLTDPIEERVGEMRMGPRNGAVTGVMSTGTSPLKNQNTGIKITVRAEPQKLERQEKQNTTWANVVRRVPESTTLTQKKVSRGQFNKIVLGLLSRNNPVSKVKV